MLTLSVECVRTDTPYGLGKGYFLDVFAILEYAIVDCGHPVGDFDSAWHIESCESIITDGFQSFWHFSVHFGQIILICRSMTYVERVSPDFFQVGWKRGLQLCGSVKSPFTDNLY